jgi:hypothetical protein
MLSCRQQSPYPLNRVIRYQFMQGGYVVRLRDAENRENANPASPDNAYVVAYPFCQEYRPGL